MSECKRNMRMTDNSPKSCKWLITFCDPEKHGFDHDNIKRALLKIENLTYWCMCDELAKTEIYHTHLFLFCETPVSFSLIKKLFFPAHFNLCRGSVIENRDYVRKQGKYKNAYQFETNLKDTFEESEWRVEKPYQKGDHDE